MKTIFEELTQSPETLGNFLDSIPVLEAPWDKAFQERFCAMCKAKNCDAENCEHMEERNNPHWWLALKR